MINSVNTLNTLNCLNFQKPQLINNSDKPVSYLPEWSSNLAGMNTLGAYNIPIIAQNIQKPLQPSLPVILQPEAISSMDGNRIYNSLGVLDSIIQKRENYTNIYKMDPKAPNDAISKIETFDNTTGCLLRVQNNLNDVKPGKIPQILYIEINDINPALNRISKSTTYKNGEPVSIREIEYGPNGYKKTYEVNKNSSFIKEDFNADVTKATMLNEKGFVDYIETTDRKNETRQTVYYKNNVPSKIENKTSSPIPNTTGKNPLADYELIPSSPYLLAYDPKLIPGERRFFSNGVLESIHTQAGNGFLEHKFSLSGDLEGILEAKDPLNPKLILFNKTDDGRISHSINENLSQNLGKITTYNDNGTIEVRVVNRETKEEKCARYSRENRLLSYVETDKDHNNIVMTYDKQGNLKSIA